MDRPPLLLATQKLVGLSGKVILVRENARRLAARGWPVTVAAQELDREAFAAPGVRALAVARPPLGRAARIAWFHRRIGARARRTGALVVGHGEGLYEQDVLHLHNAVHRAFEVLHGRGMTLAEEPAYARAQRRVLSAGGFRLLVANSTLMRDDLVARYGLDPDRVVVVHPGHDPERFHLTPPPAAAALRRELAPGRDDLAVGLITSGDFEKRAVGPFLDALGALPGELRARLRAIVVGKPGQLDPYRERARAAGVGDRVQFLDPRPDVEVLYHALDLYVHPAPFEEFGMTVLEAMACGVPVLTAPTVGASELVSGAARGELLAGVDVASLREGMARLLADPTRRRALAEAGTRAAADATWERNVEAHERAYLRVAAERTASPARPG